MKFFNSFAVVLFSIFGIQNCVAQNFLDSCFSSVDVGISFVPSENIVNYNADLIVWNGLDWDGDWPQANINSPLPYAKRGCRAIWIGPDVFWTTGGEGIGMRLSQPLIEGSDYAFTFTYVSHGAFSDGAFAPLIASGNTSNFNTANILGQLDPSGFDWHTSEFSFTADQTNHGDQWIFIHTGTVSSSGIVMSQCTNCFNFENYCDIDLGNDTLICPGDFIILNAFVPGATYEWHNGITLPDIVADQTGDFFVEVTLPDCVDTDTIHIGSAPVPEFDLANEFLYCFGESVILTVPDGFHSYDWSNGDTSNFIEAFLPGTYGVTVFNDNCSSYDDTELRIDEACDEMIVFPNVFTPNDDAYNDLFKPLVFHSAEALEITIYNRWGKVIHNSLNPLQGWNGLKAGKKVSEGMYFFVFRYSSSNQNAKELTGSFHLLR